MEGTLVRRAERGDVPSDPVVVSKVVGRFAKSWENDLTAIADDAVVECVEKVLMEYLLERGDYLEAKAYASTSEKLLRFSHPMLRATLSMSERLCKAWKYRQIFRYWCQRRTLFSFKMSTV